MTNFHKVCAFHNRFEVAWFGGTYAELLALLAWRHALLQEEFLEGQQALMGALLTADKMTHERYEEMLRGYIDSLVDVLYVAYGTLELLDIDADEAFHEVHNSNMSKLDREGLPIKDPETGKIKKGPDYRPPNLDRFVAKALETVTNKS